MKLSAVILTHYGGDIDRAISSVSFCDEILIVEDTSLKTEKKMSSRVRIVKRNVNGDFSAQRNYAMEEAKNDWILFIDDDEEISKELKKEIESLKPLSDSYYIRRRDFFWGQELKHGETQTARTMGFIRLMKKDSGTWIGKVHEEFKPKAEAGRLSHFINHFPHPTVTYFILKVNEYSTLRAQELLTKGATVSVFSLLGFPIGKFIYTYFVKCGFLDGPAGFAYSFMMSFHSFLVRAKLLQYEKIGTKV